jgi:hypothetical protein
VASAGLKEYLGIKYSVGVLSRIKAVDMVDCPTWLVAPVGAASGMTSMSVRLLYFLNRSKASRVNVARVPHQLS